MIQPSLQVVVMLEVATARCRSRRPSGRQGEMRGRGGGVDDGSPVSLPTATARPLDRLGFRSIGGVVAARSTSFYVPLAPTSSL
jgi:hypothetical protein